MRTKSSVCLFLLRSKLHGLRCLLESRPDEEVTSVVNWFVLVACIVFNFLWLSAGFSSRDYVLGWCLLRSSNRTAPKKYCGWITPDVKAHGRYDNMRPTVIIIEVHCKKR